MKPGVIVNTSKTYNESPTSNTQPTDWYKEEKWMRINDWISEIEKETLKNNQELAIAQTRRIKTILENIKAKDRYQEQSMPPYFIADIDRLNRNWNIINQKKSDENASLEEENITIRKEIERLDEMKKNLRYRY